MSDYSPDEVRGSSQLSWSDWDELPDRLDIEFPPEKFKLPSIGSPSTPHDGPFGPEGLRNGPVEGAQFLPKEQNNAMGLHVNESIPFAHGHMGPGTAETRALDGNPFGLTFAFHAGANNAQNAPGRGVDANLLDPQILGISTGSPQPRRSRRVPRSNVPHSIMSATRDDEIPAAGSFQSTATSSQQPHQGQTTTIQPASTLLPPAEISSQQPLRQLTQIINSHIPAQTERFLSSIEMLSVQIRGSMLLLHRQHALAFTIYCHVQSLEQTIRMRLWDEYLNNMRFHCINIRDGLVASLKAICWSFAEWMGVFKHELPCGVVLRANDALRQANELKAAIDHFVYPTWEDMVTREVAREQPINISGLTINQLVGGLAGGGGGGGVFPNH
ncbi:hypothetical protein ACJ72_02973 [Emergomyces africanus]|uniref:Uncharacterized protein n=1 Tax=Emergomyces africanus TaxID=1955775 RepID=A0A1B7P0Y6_9EURO|nr:hypothetical protein ACJ72_02973 [Emergomyces africanus]